jgi:hypothetical protein
VTPFVKARLKVERHLDVIERRSGLALGSESIADLQAKI